MSNNVNRTSLIRNFSLTIFFLFGLQTSAIEAKQDIPDGVPYHIVANYIHSIIEADRTLYTTHVVDRMQETGTAIASERWEDRNALPLPAQMLLLSGEKVNEKGKGLSFRLASLWPIYKKNGPGNDFERQGLQAVQDHPATPYTGIVSQNGERFFEAIYADLAVSTSCVNCHNRHLLSPKRDHKLGDVMGGIIIAFPLTQKSSSR